MSFSTVRQPETSPHRIMSAGKIFQMSAEVASQLILSLSSVLKLQEINKALHDVQLGYISEANETCEELEFHITAGSKQISSLILLQPANDTPDSQKQHVDTEEEVEK